MHTLAQGKIILVQSCRTGQHLKRHPNDLKLYEGRFGDEDTPIDVSETELLEAWRQAFEFMDGEQTYDDEPPMVAAQNGNGAEVEAGPLRRSTRARVPNTRYYNNDYVNSVSQHT